MQNTVRLFVMLLTTVVATLSWQQTASACGGGGDEGLAVLGAALLLEVPPVVLGAGDLLMAGTQREPTRGYAMAETIVSVPALALSSIFAVEAFRENGLDNARGVAVVAVAVPALTLAHGIWWLRIHKRRRNDRQQHPSPTNAPGMQAASRVAPFAASSRLETSWRFAAVPVSDGKALGAGIGLLGRF